MPSVTKEVFITAPLNEIYDYAKIPSNLPQIWPSLVEINNEKLLDNGGYRFHWKYIMSGITFKGAGEYTDIVPNLWLISNTHGDIESTHTWTFRFRDNKTKVTLTVDYRLPTQLIKRLGVFTLAKNEKEAELILDNLRMKFEGRAKAS
jgi:uncharacterized membrane protein